MSNRMLDKWPKRYLLLFATLVLALGMTFVLMREHAESPQARKTAEHGERVASSADSPALGARESKQRLTPASDAKQTVSNTPRSLFDRSKNLYQFVADLKPFLDRNDPSALEAYATAKSECAPLSLNPNFAEGYRNSAVRPIAGYMLDDYIERCRDLASSEQIRQADIKDLYTRALEGGDATALAQQFTSASASLSPKEASETMRDIIESGNPYAINELSPAMEEDRSASYTPFGGSEAYSVAWQLVACDLGMDCGPRSYIVRQMCLFGGICSTGGLREVLSQTALSPHEFRRAEEAEAMILKAIENGKYESLVK